MASTCHEKLNWVVTRADVQQRHKVEMTEEVDIKAEVVDWSATGGSGTKINSVSWSRQGSTCWTKMVANSGKRELPHGESNPDPQGENLVSWPLDDKGVSYSDTGNSELAALGWNLSQFWGYIYGILQPALQLRPKLGKSGGASWHKVWGRRCSWLLSVRMFQVTYPTSSNAFTSTFVRSSIPCLSSASFAHIVFMHTHAHLPWGYSILSV